MTSGTPLGAEASEPDGHDQEGAPRRRVLAIVGSIVAQTTVLTALLFYFGMLHAYWFFSYFDINYTVLELTTQDFLIRSADGLFVPMTALAAITLCGLWAHRALHRLLPERIWARLRVIAGRAAKVVGWAFVLVALIAVVQPHAFAQTLGLPGLCLSVGVLLLVTVRPQPRAGQPVAKPPSTAARAVEWAACFVLVSVGLFWAVGDYSAGVGTGRGGAVLTSMSTTPDVAVLSERSLSVRIPGVTETRCSSENATYGYRYDGLKLIQQAGDRYVFLPRGWTPGNGPALVIPRSDSLRLEFTTSGQASSPSC